MFIESSSCSDDLCFMSSISVMTRAQIEQQLLEDACDDTASRTKRQTKMMDIPDTVVERALKESIPRFSDVSII